MIILLPIETFHRSVSCHDLYSFVSTFCVDVADTDGDTDCDVDEVSSDVVVDDDGDTDCDVDDVSSDGDCGLE